MLCLQRKLLIANDLDSRVGIGRLMPCFQGKNYTAFRTISIYSFTIQLNKT